MVADRKAFMVMWWLSESQRLAEEKSVGLCHPMPGELFIDPLVLRKILEEGDSSAWAGLIQEIRRFLHGYSKAVLRRLPRLARRGDREDLVQEFLVRKILPEEKRKVMLGPVLAGRRELEPRLKRSFRNFCNGSLRKKVLPMGEKRIGTEPEEVDPRAPADGDAWQRILDLLEQQRQAILALPDPSATEIPSRAVLLLAQRLEFGKQVEREFQARNRNQTDREVVECMLPWTKKEQELPLPPEGSGLQETWEELCSISAGDFQGMNGPRVAEILGCSPNVWHQWINRSRRRLIENLTPGVARKLFPTWPARLFEPPGPKGGAS